MLSMEVVMCYAKPGPRCSSHAESKLEASKRALGDAEASGEEGRIARAYVDYDKARKEYALTPAGIESVREHSPSNARKLEGKRESLVDLKRKVSEGGVFSVDEKVMLAEYGSHEQMMGLVSESDEDARIGVALAEYGNDRVRDALRGSQYSSVRKRVAMLASDDVKRKMVNDRSEGVRRTLAIYGDELTQTMLLKDESVKVRSVLAERGTDAVRHKLLNDPDERVRASVAQYGSHNQSKILVSDSSPVVRRQVAAYGATELRNKLLHDPDFDTRRLARKNLHR